MTTMGLTNRPARSATLAGRAWFCTLEAPTAASFALPALLLVCFFLVPYLPSVDLPQHAAQIGVWLHGGDPDFLETRHFTVNWRTPYLTAYVLARALAAWVGVLPALKLVVWLSIVAHFFAFRGLVRKLGHPGWLALLGLPLGLGYSFYFGLISFSAAVPLSLFAITGTLSHRERPTWRRGAVLGALLCATFLTHGFALALTILIALPLLLRGGGTWPCRLAPLLMPALLGAVWLLPGTSVQSIGTTLWEPRLFDLVQVPALLLAASAADHAASLLGLCFLVLIALAMGSPSREPERLLPLCLVLLGYCLFPYSLSGFGPIHPRFAAFVVPALLIACEPRREPRSLHLPMLATALCLAWFGLFAWRLIGFERETRPIAAFVERTPGGLSVRPIVFERESEAFPGLPALLHLSGYYAAEKGGLQGYSFAMYPTSVVRYLPTHVPGMQGGAEWHPERFSPESELELYDCFLVHSTKDRSLALFGSGVAQVTLAFHEKSWWAYRVRSSLETRARLTSRRPS